MIESHCEGTRVTRTQSTDWFKRRDSLPLSGLVSSVTGYLKRGATSDHHRQEERRALNKVPVATVTVTAVKCVCVSPLHFISFGGDEMKLHHYRCK